MELDGDLADAEVVGDLLVEPAYRDLPQDLAFARREQSELGYLNIHGLRLRPLLDIAPDADCDRIEQRLVAHRLREEVDGASLHRLHRHRNIAVRSEKD